MVISLSSSVVVAVVVRVAVSKVLLKEVLVSEVIVHTHTNGRVVMQLAKPFGAT